MGYWLLRSSIQVGHLLCHIRLLSVWLPTPVIFYGNSIYFYKDEATG